MHWQVGAAGSDAHPGAELGLRWLKIAVIYFALGVTLGVGIGMTENFTLRPVHAHINLLGWVSMSLFGAIHLMFPLLATTALARVHFWLYNVAFPVTMVGLSFLITGHPQAGPVVGIASMALAIAVFAFAINVVANARIRRRTASSLGPVETLAPFAD